MTFIKSPAWMPHFTRGKAKVSIMVRRPNMNSALTPTSELSCFDPLPSSTPATWVSFLFPQLIKYAPGPLYLVAVPSAQRCSLSPSSSLCPMSLQGGRLLPPCQFFTLLIGPCSVSSANHFYLLIYYFILLIYSPAWNVTKAGILLVSCCIPSTCNRTEP